MRVEHAHKGQGGVAQVEVWKSGRERVARTRPGHAHGGPLVGDRRHRHPQRGPNHLQQKLQVAHHLGRLRRGGRHEKLGFADARGGAVVHDDAVFAQHKAVARLAHGQLGETVHINAVQKLGGVGPLHVNLAQRGRVGHAYAVAHKFHLGLVSLPQRGAVGAVPQRAQPQAGFHLHAAVRLMPIVHGGAALGLEMRPHIAPGQRTQAGRGIGRAECSGACGCYINTARSRHQAQAVEVGGLALVRAHAQRGVALEVLDRLVALAVRELHVGHGHIVLEINKGLVAGLVTQQRACGHKGGAGVVFEQRCGVIKAVAADGGGLSACLPARFNGFAPGLAAHHGTRAKLGAVKAAGHKAGNVGAVDGLDVAVRTQMHRGRPAARHGDQVYVELHGPAHDAPAGRVITGHPHALGVQATVHIGHGAAALHRDARAAGRCQQVLRHRAAQIHHIDLRARVCQGQRVGIGRVVVDAKHRALARRHRVAVDVSAHRTRQHDAGFVVARKHQRALQRAAGHDDGARTHRAHALARHAVRRIGHARRRALNHAHGIAVVHAKRGGPRKHAHLARGLQIGQHGGQPLALGAASRVAQERSAQRKVLLHQHDLRPGARRVQGRA